MSFPELKYAIGLNCFHAKKAHVRSARNLRVVGLNNYSSIITMSIEIPLKRIQHTQHLHQLNSTNAIQLCCQHLRGGISVPNLVAQIHGHLLPVHPGRSSQRKVNSKPMVNILSAGLTSENTAF